MVRPAKQSVKRESNGHHKNGKKHYAQKGKSRSEGRSLWSGSISFGLVNIPVQLQVAVRTKGIRFHMFRRGDHCKIRQKLICEIDHKEVARDQVVKGYELGAGEYAMLEESEIKRLAPKSAREINLIQFIDLKEIDPIYYSHTYYLLPAKNGKKAYFLLVEALKRSGKVGIAKFVMRSHQYLAAIRIYHDALCLETMHFHDEIVEPKKPKDDSVQKLNARELNMAIKLIESLSAKFHPEKLYDDYRKTLLEVIGRKKKVKTIEDLTDKEQEGTEVSDLISVLEASLKQNNRGRIKV